MRNDKEMMELILNVAKNDERVRVVTMEGSKNNINATKDIFQDYDISFLVKNIEYYKSNDDWLDIFGKRIIMQKPQGMHLFPPSPGNWYNYLMLFEDGNRIDLTLVPYSEIKEHFSGAGSLTTVLLDKDNECPIMEQPSDHDSIIKKPSNEYIDDCCNEFWWLTTYVVKGLCRGQLLNAIHFIGLIREQLLLMISWNVGISTNFSQNIGEPYNGFKYLRKYVSKELWDNIMQTYNVGDTDKIWETLMHCCKLFEITSREVCEKLNYVYPNYDENVLKYIKKFMP